MSAATLVTGAAGFIGFHLADGLLARGSDVIGIDDLNPYYDPKLKTDRVELLEKRYGQRWTFLRCDFADHVALRAALAERGFERIAHLGAQAGVRYSIDNPQAYARSNLLGHVNLLEIARERAVPMVYASSSSVYGIDQSMPFTVDQRVDRPVSFYAATKRSNELASESYAHLYRIPLTGLRFFTVYGPWGRPDMAPWLFTEAILDGRPIRLFNAGKMRRDFTYIDDVIRGVIAALDRPPRDDGTIKPGGGVATHNIYNIGNSRAEPLEDFIAAIEQATGRQAIRQLAPMQPGDVSETYADVSATTRDLGYVPSTAIEEGVPRFVRWYREWSGR